MENTDIIECDGSTHPEGDETRDDDARGGVEMWRHRRERLAADDAVDNDVALHGEDVEDAGDDRAVVPDQCVSGESDYARRHCPPFMRVDNALA